MTASPSTIGRAAAECVILVDGDEINDFFPLIGEVEVTMTRRAASTCRLIVDTVREENGDWLVQDAGVFEPWKSLRIDVQFGGERDELFRGFVREIRVDHPGESGSATVTVYGQDETLQLDREHTRRTWSTADEPLTDGQIARQIAKDANLTGGSAIDEGLRNASLYQDDTSIRFLRRRAEANGFELYIRAGVLHFHAPRLDEAPLPTIVIDGGEATNCLSFSASYDGHRPDGVRLAHAKEVGSEMEYLVFEPNLRQLGERQASSADAKDSDTGVANPPSPGSGLLPFEWYQSGLRGATRAELEARAQSAANDNSWKVSAEGELDGALYGQVLRSHSTVEVDGVGSTFGGLYYVDEVTHLISGTGYRQRFTLVRNAVGQSRESESRVSTAAGEV